ncbi:MAG: apolipoprotein N-acyltransferase [Acidobacteriota bacterium]
MDRPFFKGGVLSLISGAALWLPFHDGQFFFLAWVGLTPFLFFLVSKPSWRITLLAHAVMTSAYLGGVLYWIPQVLVVYGNLGWLMALAAFLVMLVVLSLLLLPFTLMTRWAAGKSVILALGCAPGFWLLTELCRNVFPLNGFPWALLGYSQIPYLWIIQTSDIGGVYLVSVLLVGANSAFVGALRLKTFKPLFIFASPFLMANLYGVYRVNWWQPDPGPMLKVALVQPNIGLSQDKEHYAVKYYETLPEYYRQAVEAGAEWVIFPEAPNPFLYQEDFYFKTFWESQVSTQQAFLLFNTTLFEVEPTLRYFNSALMLGPEGTEVYRYYKNHLVPFGEYVPFQDWLGVFFAPLVQEVSGFSPGDELQIGNVSNTPFATLICYEGIFPELSRRLVGQGAQVFVNITNDSWYGRSTAPRQHLEMILFRAIETRKPFLRSANSGYSAVIDYRGRPSQEMGLFEEGVLLAQVEGNTHRSIYSYVGDWINILMAGVTILVGVIGAGRKSPKKKGR